MSEQKIALKLAGKGLAGVGSLENAQGFLCLGHANVEKPSFLLLSRLAVRPVPATVRDENMGEFQALGAMDSAEIDPVAKSPLLALFD